MPKTVFDSMIEKWPSAIVARSEVARFSGGVLHPRTMANLDSQGQGPTKHKLGRKAFYLAEDLIQWMIKYMEKKGVNN